MKACGMGESWTQEEARAARELRARKIGSTHRPGLGGRSTLHFPFPRWAREDAPQIALHPTGPHRVGPTCFPQVLAHREMGREGDPGSFRSCFSDKPPELLQNMLPRRSTEARKRAHASQLYMQDFDKGFAAVSGFPSQA